ncbi:hypothetical protein D9M68_896210 [compost metagenome]
MMKPPRIPRASANTQSSGMLSNSASKRGRTRNSSGGKPKVFSASISSLACMLPSSAA